VPITFDIDPDKLPADALARDTKKRIVVPRRAVGLVALDVVRFIPRQIVLRGPDGAPLAAGTMLRAQPSGELLMVGFDGVVDFNAGGSDRRLVASGEAGPACVAEIDPARLGQGAAPDALPHFECRAGLPGVLTENVAEPEPKRAGRGLAARNRR
jgi:outer membrane usher protein FimD/PapC